MSRPHQRAGISFDRVASVYDATRSLPPDVESGIADALARSIGTERTLELGVGTARWARALEQRNVPVTGLDLSRRMLEMGRAKGFGRTVQGEVSRTPFRAAAFGTVLSNHLLHLVADPAKVLLEVARVSTGPLRSVLEYESSTPDLMISYLELVEHSWAAPGPPGVSERRLARELPPDRVLPAGTFRLTSSADRALEELGSRAFRDTWATPEPLHRSVLEKLRARYGGSDISSATRLEIVEWDRSRLLEFALHLDHGGEIRSALAVRRAK
ncbi:MAG: methyltransferase domain-containing protein [Thermoplasmata archaeon]|nr:methyltransferase domain-containing protein [Thermoplasmata archaeon]